MINLNTIAEKIAAGDANSEYREWIATVRQDLRLLDRQLTKHEARQRQNPNDYGHVGDIQHVESGLQEMMRFLGI
jgi:acetylglutamate kinase